MKNFKIPSSWMNRAINVSLVGVGGTGSEMLDELYRMHTLLVRLGGEGLTVTAYDPKTVSSANIGRQRFWIYDMGHNKAEVMVNRFNSFGGVKWSFCKRTFELDDMKNVDLIVTCVDTPKIRAELGKSAKTTRFRKEVLWLDCGNDDFTGNVVLGHIHCASDDKLPNVFDLYPMLETMEVSNEPSCSTNEALSKQDYGINRSVAREAQAQDQRHLQEPQPVAGRADVAPSRTALHAGLHRRDVRGIP